MIGDHLKTFTFFRSFFDVMGIVSKVPVAVGALDQGNLGRVKFLELF